MFQGARLHSFQRPYLRTEPEGKCAAMFVYGTHLAVLPFRQTNILEDHAQGHSSFLDDPHPTTPLSARCHVPLSLTTPIMFVCSIASLSLDRVIWWSWHLFPNVFSMCATLSFSTATTTPLSSSSTSPHPHGRG